MAKNDLLMLNEVLQKWHNNNRRQLELLINGDEPLFVQAKQGDKQIEVKGDILKGLRLGALLALETIGELPYTLEKD